MCRHMWAHSEKNGQNWADSAKKKGNTLGRLREKSTKLGRLREKVTKLGRHKKKGECWPVQNKWPLAGFEQTKLDKIGQK